MAAIHELSNVATLDQLNLWGVPPTQVSVERDIVADYRPVAVLKSDQPITFVVGSAIDEYILLNESYFYLKFRVILTKTTTGALDLSHWDNIVPANNLLYSMFKTIEISIGDKVITNCPQNIAYRSYIDNLLGFTSSAKASHLTSQFWIEDEAKRVGHIKPPPTPSSGTAPPVEKGRHVELMGRLPFDLTYQNRALLGGCTLTIRMTPHDPTYFFKLPTGFKVKLEFLDAIMYVHKAKATSQLVTAHAKALAVAPARYPFTRAEVKHHSVAKDSNECVISNAIVGLLPRRMFITIVPTSAFSGSYAQNPYKFIHKNLNFAAVYLDGTQYPQQPYEPDFENGCVVRELLGLYQALNQNTTDSYVEIDRDKFINGNTILGFNFTPDLSSGPGAVGHCNPLQTGAMRVVLKFNGCKCAPVLRI